MKIRPMNHHSMRGLAASLLLGAMDPADAAVTDGRPVSALRGARR
jgi:hypothetical protein